MAKKVSTRDGLDVQKAAESLNEEEESASFHTYFGKADDLLSYVVRGGHHDMHLRVLEQRAPLEGACFNVVAMWVR